MKLNSVFFNVLLLLVPLALAVIFYRYIPAQIPIHYSLDGSISYAGKQVVFLIALLPFVLVKYWQWRARD